jgi:hypothetical protein
VNRKIIELGLTNTLTELKMHRRLRVCTFTTTKPMLKLKADLVEMDDGNMIAGLAVHVTFIKLSHIVQGSTPSQTARTALDAT